MYLGIPYLFLSLSGSSVCLQLSLPTPDESQELGTLGAVYSPVSKALAIVARPCIAPAILSKFCWAALGLGWSVLFWGTSFIVISVPSGPKVVSRSFKPADICSSKLACLSFSKSAALTASLSATCFTFSVESTLASPDVSGFCGLLTGVLSSAITAAFSILYDSNNF